jgi:hypothetical protein
MFLVDLERLKTAFCVFIMGYVPSIYALIDRSFSRYTIRRSISRAPDGQSNTPRIYSDKNLSFSNENLRYGLEIMSSCSRER